MMSASLYFVTPTRLQRHFRHLAPLCLFQFCALQSCHTSSVLDTRASLGNPRSAVGGQDWKKGGLYRISDYRLECGSSLLGMTMASGVATDANAASVSPEDVIHYWYKDVDMVNKKIPAAFWFAGGEVVDKEIKDKFSDVLELACAGKLDHWKSTPQGTLALVLVLDQFSRNVFRDTPRSFAQDEAAVKIVLDMMKQEWDKQLGPLERSFLYTPFMHSESLEMHEVADRMFEALAREYQDDQELHKYLAGAALKFARAHTAILKKFGRYPSRNAILGRKSTPEEEEYLASGAIWPTAES